jgi:hypothetical protein
MGPYAFSSAARLRMVPMDRQLDDQDTTRATPESYQNGTSWPPRWCGCYEHTTIMLQEWRQNATRTQPEGQHFLPSMNLIYVKSAAFHIFSVFFLICVGRGRLSADPGSRCWQVLAGAMISKPTRRPPAIIHSSSQWCGRYEHAAIMLPTCYQNATRILPG